MAIKTITELKEYFQTSKKPTEEQFGNLIDSTINTINNDSGWSSPTLLNGISNFSEAHQGARFRKKDGVVYIQGLIKGGTSQTSGSTYVLFQLPVGHRPEKKLIFATMLSTGANSRIDIDVDGKVYGMIYNNVWTVLNGIQFPVD